ncbi:MAG: alpha/beta hydrolase [Acetilactobacillus jinshanensis]
MKKSWLWGIPLAMGLGSFLISEKIFKTATHRRAKYPAPSKRMLRYAREYYRYIDWYQQIPKQNWYVYEKKTHERMIATYIPNPKPTEQTVIIAHGFGGNRETMANYAKMFYDFGFNVLMPDDRGHGQSAGKYISFGWLDQIDYQHWIQEVIKHNGKQSKILLFGVSMGGAIVSMLSGDQLPKQVKAIIDDCGYSSVQDELDYLLHHWYHLPKYPFDPIISTINRHRLGYYMTDASTTHQLAKNTRPIFFIHGAQDHYVPTYMGYRNYHATHAPKELWVVPFAGHAESFWINPQKYCDHVKAFLRDYFY